MKIMQIKCQLLKFVKIRILLVVLFFSSNTQADEILSEYLVSTSGFKIGKFVWELKTDEETYLTKISLNSSGFLSAVYNFKGEYSSEGIIVEKNFKTQKYNQFWKTKNKTRYIEIYFNKSSVIINQKPHEKEASKVNLNDLAGYSDPITSFINILSKNSSALTIDGRRAYVMKSKQQKNLDNVTLEILDYRNIWADHKRNDLEKIEFIMNKENFFPTEIYVYFKNRVFKLKKV